MVDCHELALIPAKKFEKTFVKNKNQMTTSKSYDIVFIGGGHNGLTAAAYLSRAGLKTIVLEKNAVVGGAALTEEFHPGFKNSLAAYTVSLLNPEVIRDLELDKHGLEILERPMANFWPIDDTRALEFPYGLAARQKQIAEFSKHDAKQLPAFEMALEQAADILRDLILKTPPNAGGGLLEMARAGLIARAVANRTLDEQRIIVDLFTKSAQDFLDQWFESDVVKAAFAFDGIVGAYAAPSTPGTAYVLLHHCFGEVNGKPGVWGHAKGGMGAITQAMQRSAQSNGAEIRTDVPVAKVIVEDNRATGVELMSGERINARCVAANVGPKLLFRDLLGDAEIAPGLRNRFENIKTGSGTFRMNVALSELPGFSCRPGTQQQPHHGAGIIIGPTLDYLERAYLDARTDGWSKKPIVEMLIPSSIDDTLAPPGKHVASLFVQHVSPHLPNGRTWQDESEKERFADLVIDTVTAHAPNFKGSVLARQILSPWDLEQRIGMVDGDIFHGQLSLSQLFSARPVLGHADYRMPVKNLYLCGAGAHPGGGVTGVPGRNAARIILKDMNRRWWAR